MNINIEITPKYIKPEINLLNMLIDDTLKSKKLVYSLSELGIPDFKGSKTSFLERFVKKGIHYSFKKNIGIIMPISHYNILENNISFFFTDTFKGAILEENNFKELELKYVLKFEENFTKYFYYNFVTGVEKEKNIIISLDEFRNLLGLREYERFYDFEINIIKKLKKDIDLKTDYLLEYTKIKSGEFKNNKVTALEFSIFNKISKVRNEKANELVGMISQYIKDFKFTYDMFYKALGYIDFEELKSVIKIIIKNTSDISNIENEINLFITNKFKLNNYKKIYEFFGKYKNPLTLQNFIFKNLSGIVELEFFKDNIASIDFLKKLYFAKEGEQLFFEEKDIIIGIKYFKKKESVIEVFQRIK